MIIHTKSIPNSEGVTRCGDINIILSTEMLLICSKACRFTLFVLPVKALFRTAFCVGNSKLPNPLALKSLYNTSDIIEH
jgi:hypothetical protein